MKNIDLNACGVQEMNAAEATEVNGGNLLAIVAFMVEASLIAFTGQDAVGHTANALKEGWKYNAANGWPPYCSR